MIEEQIELVVIPSAEQIDTNTKIAIEFYYLGPLNPSSPNEQYWAKMAKMWRITSVEAKRKRCSNCEYYNNTVPMMEAMETIPQNEYDLYDGQAQRGYCHRLNFICHTSRTCSIHEPETYEMDN